MSMVLKVETRGTRKRSEIRKLKETGSIPAVVYGKKVGSEPVAILERDFMAILKKDPNSIITMDIPNSGKHAVMVTDIQRDKVKRQIVHVDFFQVDMTEEITTSVRLAYTGDPVGVKEEGGILQTSVHDVEVKCLPNQIPTELTIDISPLKMGETLTVADITTPEGVEITNDPEEVLVSVLIPQKPEEDETEEASTDASESPSADSEE